MKVISCRTQKMKEQIIQYNNLSAQEMKLDEGRKA